MPPIVYLDKKDIRTLNANLTKLQQLYDEICKAEQVGVPGLDSKKQDCLDLQERIKALKLAYAPTSS